MIVAWLSLMATGSARSKGRARIETGLQAVLREAVAGSARSKGRARIETTTSEDSELSSSRSARSKGRARIETPYELEVTRAVAQ